MKVLSLFDGISCGMVALERAGIQVDRYAAYEIAENAIKISKKNYPQIKHCGDVTTADFAKYAEFELLIGGSPCQSLSITRGEIRTNLEGKSKLFFEYARALQEMKPKYFLFENVASMNQESKEIISEILGCEPIFINSNCFVAQDRPRLYWTNIPVDTSGLKECDICLQDIMENDVDESYFYSYPLLNVDMNKQVCATMDFKINEMHKRIFNPKFKVHTLTACAGGNLQKKVYVNGRARKLTPLEYERLQGLPDNYTEGVAKTHRYNALGNGWTVDVIAHIFSYLPDEYKKEKEIKQMELRINEVALPEQITFNYEELKQELTEKVSMYETMVYTDDQIKEAKADKANLNKLKKALNDERIRREKEYMQPFNEFKAKINEIISIIDKPVMVIDKQVKEYEEKLKQDKMKAIQDLWCSLELIDGRLDLKMIFNQKWLNASVSMKSIQTEMEEQIKKFNDDMASLCNLPEFGFEAQQVYISSLDLSKALNEAHRLSEIAKAKAEHEAAMQKIVEEQKAREEEQARLAAEAEVKKAEPQPQPAQEGFMNPPVEDAPAKEWVSFRCLLTEDDAFALGEFFRNRNIAYEQI